MHSFINLFRFSSFLFLIFNSISEGKLFELHSLPHGYLTFLGDSHLDYDDAIALTKVAMPTDAPRSAGMVLYNRPISFLDPHSKKVSSFSTMFAFSIRNIHGNGKAYGDGLSFLISPDNNLLGSPGFLGLVDSTDITRNKFIAIEFDTKCDPMFQDPNDNHLGLDINNLSSVQFATPFDVDLKSGDLFNAWIDYKSDEKRLEVFLSALNLKPAKPLLKVDIDLFDYLKEKMFVGLSAASEGSMQLTRIEEWEFTIVEFSPPPIFSPSPSPPELRRISHNPSESEHRHSQLSKLVIDLIVGVCFVPFVVFFGWLFREKLIWMIQELEGASNIDLRTIRSSGGTSDIRLSIPCTNLDEVARGLIFEKVLDNEAEIIRVKTVKCSIPVCAAVFQQ